jgi:hypothetical protein
MDGAHKLANGFCAALLGGVFIALPAAEVGSLRLWLAVMAVGMTTLWTIGYVVGDRFVDWLSESCTAMIQGHDD